MVIQRGHWVAALLGGVLLLLLSSATAIAAVEEIPEFTYLTTGMPVPLEIHGHRPTGGGTHPLFVYVAATDPWHASVQYMTQQMAERGFVAVSVDYWDRNFGYPASCDVITESARQIFDASDPASAISAIAKLPDVDINKGIVVSGLSFGANIVVMAKNFDPAVQAAFVTAHAYRAWGEDCFTIGKITLPSNRIRSALGADDTWFGDPNENRHKLEATTGASCGPQATQCIAPNGSGWWLVSAAEVPGGNAEHCFQYVGECGWDFDPSFPTGAAWWALPASFDWLAKFGSPPSLATALLPGSRSVQVGHPATAFAAAINTTGNALSGCTIRPQSNVPADFLFQATDVNNALTGITNGPVDIPASGIQNFVLAFTPTAAFAPTDIAFDFECLQGAPATSLLGLNTLQMSASDLPVPDIIGLTTVVDLNVSVGGAGLFAVGSANLGATGDITISLDTGNEKLPLVATLCRTDANGGCIGTANFTETSQYPANSTVSVAVFVFPSGDISNDPAHHRLFVRFTDAAGIVRGSTSSAVRTQ